VRLRVRGSPDRSAAAEQASDQPHVTGGTSYRSRKQAKHLSFDLMPILREIDHSELREYVFALLFYKRINDQSEISELTASGGRVRCNE
jgi:hypothetical protein